MITTTQPIFNRETDNGHAAWLRQFVQNVNNIIIVETPASHTAPGTQWQVAIDANYIYVCVAKNSWKRVAIASW